ncbi:DUF4192 domain-containing protein [Fodinicola acaciae]|uniref:DUF4192 domain-containing protein n=1 Tax=Fodinicola acaciae TaxID=2681555 RepID=UPI0013D41187|nr:DUF4192 domain-containing protein [Fodinicola acaciae]
MTSPLQPSTGVRAPDADPRTLIRLRGPAEVAAALPYMLGFHPAESLVGIGIGANKRVTLTARLDLGPPPYREQAAAMATYLRHASSVEAILVVVSDLPKSVVKRAGTAARVAARKAGMAVVDVMHVSDGRWWSLRCRNPRCCPPGGEVIDQSLVGQFAAELAALGRVVYPDRAAVTASIAYDQTAASEVRAALDAALAEQDRLAATAGSGAVVDAGERIVGAAVIGRRDRPRDLTVDEIGRLGAALQLIAVRDRALRWTVSPLAEVAENVWYQLTRRLPSPYAAPAATLLAVQSYNAGDCTLAGDCAARALTDDPRYTMAKLVAEAVMRAIPPGDFRAAMREAWLCDRRSRRSRRAA